MAEWFKGNTETLVSLLLDVHSRRPTVQNSHQDLVEGRNNHICVSSEGPN